MLIVDIHALLAVHSQDLLNEVVVHRVRTPDAKHVVGVQGAVGQLAARLDDVPVLHLEARVGHGVGPGVPVGGGNDDV